MGGVLIKLEGLGDVIKTFDELAQQIGDKKARSKILIPAARDAMKPILAMAQQNAPVDSGALRLLLQVEARRPTSRDRRSKYITGNDAVIATVTTASGKKMRAMSEGKGLERTRRRIASFETDAHVGAYKAQKFEGFKSDARAIAQEFGTSKMPAQPYLRPALESQSQDTVNRLADGLRKYILKFRAKT
jgi:HK97 gp10 family phage protein